MTTHRFFVDAPIAQAAPLDAVVPIEGPEAAHAHVRRARQGESVALLDGLGGVATGVIVSAGSKRHPVTVAVHGHHQHPPPAPHIDVCAAVPQGDRADALVDLLSQAGADAWTPLWTDRAVVRPRSAKLDRLQRLAREACKQSGRPWLLRIGPESPPGTLLAHAAPVAHAASLTLIADSAGEPIAAAELAATARASAHIRVFVGPEGGWSPAERALFDHAPGGPARLVCLGPHTLRTEAAAFAAAAILRALTAPAPPSDR
ncbi:MAG: hypothetical protein C0468_04440 [Planctomyces sp.]|nr:hypothetical protein [Planctomyces sp.]